MHIDLALMFECYVVLMTVHKVEKILKGSLDSIPSPSEKIQIMGGKFAFTTFPPIIWIFTEGEVMGSNPGYLLKSFLL